MSARFDSDENDLLVEGEGDKILSQKHFAPLCGLCGLNPTAETAKERQENLTSELATSIF
jgi:hypothetical protein